MQFKEMEEEIFPVKTIRDYSEVLLENCINELTRCRLISRLSEKGIKFNNCENTRGRLISLVTIVIRTITDTTF